MSKKILVLDDEALLGLALAEELELEGFEVVGPFTTSQHAIEAIESGKPDAAILDVNLGVGRTSFQLAEMLENRKTPFVFLTGYSEFSQIKKRFPNVSFVSKPVDIGTVVQKLARLEVEGNKKE